MEKTCKDCGQTKSLLEFRLHSKTRPHRRSYCKPCDNRRTQARKERQKSTKPEIYNKQYERRLARRKEERRLGINAARYLLEDCRRNDAKKNRLCNLTLDQITILISAGVCSYCGEESLRMSLDRINNALGHTVDNVVPCCIRCNMMRGAIPFPAWEEMLPGIRSARQQGLFAGWTGEIHKRSSQ